MTVWLKALMIGPPILVSAALYLVALASMPAPVAVAAAALLTGVLGVLVCGAGEGAAIWVLWGGRRLRGEELEALAAARTVLCRAGLGPPSVELRVRRDAAVAALGAGRRTVMMSAGLVDAVSDGRLPADQAAAVLAHASAVVRSGAVRRDPFLAVATLPWTALSVLTAALSRPLRRIPTVALVWRARAVAVAVAVVSAIADDHVALALLLTVIGGVSYGLPIARRRWQALIAGIGDEGVVEAGLGPSLATLLIPGATTPRGRERLRRLDATARRPRPLGLVGHNPTA